MSERGPIPAAGTMTATGICLTEDSLDDLLRAAFETVLERGEAVLPTKGRTRELRGVTLQLTNPRARLSRSESRGKVFSALGELLWYLSGSAATDRITHYIPAYQEYDEDGVVHGGYGPRLRGDNDQLATVIALLRRKPSTRQAVIQIFDRVDLLEPHKDIPCTCTLQFLNRQAGLDAVVYMRSNDAFIGLPHDVFCFSMIQELVARSIGVDVGRYIHVTGSLHLYDTKIEDARRFLDEGYYFSNAMPPMPDADPLAAISEILVLEEQLRCVTDPLSITVPSDPYWGDLARLLIVFELVRGGRADDVSAVVDGMNTEVFKLYVSDHLDRKTRAE
jgi:thymidylate synthase